LTHFQIGENDLIISHDRDRVLPRGKKMIVGGSIPVAGRQKKQGESLLALSEDFKKKEGKVVITRQSPTTLWRVGKGGGLVVRR